MKDYLLGLGTIPTIGVVVMAATLGFDTVMRKIERLKPNNIGRRARIAGRLFASRRAWVFGRHGSHFTIAFLAGTDWTVEDRARDTLLDEFDPQPEPTATIAPSPKEDVR